MTMNCNEAATLVDVYADGELDGFRGHAIEKHLRGCANCAAMHHRVIALRARFHAEVPYFPASPALRARVLASTAGQRAAAPAPSRPARDLLPWPSRGPLA